MDLEADIKLRKDRFIWGLVLAWAPAIPLIIGMSNVFRGLSEQKATGLGAVAGGLDEAFLIFGFVAMFAFQMGGIVLLARSFSGEHRARAFFSVVSMAWSMGVLLLFVLFLWMYLVYLPHR